ncbi:PP2C family protein-serine/threonine phosphatase [Actinomadura madurae]|uniref:PP2C family protein-serine/threonine phosphatase n=1 Tax=Actinomadura madurae TaxID=1993 RepID=UPI0020D219D5|nr:protein phosphatase 2C domain-containing protein [Actinomadura madurae]MCP9954694.1 protein phosphatase 2C domain-containing protein [Actinomadura madurae]MCP9971433.1 protein phosphatase 2C domain-containing protein [Actinomadura madurae]MCP9983924.1 protein phosphatase 2C domain-containing protein [Actinomadura madurae]MCQ0004511.1 protein phosphatase 2C domain-containing protein [Actinomadura madurae]MCQ0020157.1 protein phosphatase 2C domain-containing protein [Actinomadura madurae]
MSLAIEAALGTHVGLVRKRNEDSGYVGHRLLAVADGLGGHAAGDVASTTVINALKPYDREVAPEDLATTLGQAINEASDALRTRAAGDPCVTGMGTTLVAVLWSGNRAVFANIGDSRIYQLRNDQLMPFSEDHVYGRLVSDAETVPHLPPRLARFLDGRAEGRSPDLTVRELKAGDRLLLCSDGLSAIVDLDDVRQTLASANDPSETVNLLIEATLARGAPDNVTAIVADVQPIAVTR